MEAASFLIVIFRFSPFLHLRKLFMQDGGAFNRFLASRKKEPLRNRGGPAAPSSAGYFSQSVEEVKEEDDDGVVLVT